MTSHSAIIGFGTYLPSHRITVEEIARHHGQEPRTIERGLGVEEKTVPEEGEDTFTLAFEAGKQAIEQAGIAPCEISAVFVGSESHPYAVKPTSGMVAAALGIDPFCHSSDLEFACKAGTAAMQIIDSMVRAGQVRYGLAIGADTAQARPGDALEYTAAAGAAALVIGADHTENAICRIDATLSFTTDTPDFWRSAGSAYPSHAGRFTGEPAYFRHVREVTNGILEITKVKPEELHHVVFHMPNAKFPRKVGKELGFTDEQLALGMIVSEVGNTYSACSLLGLARVLEHARKNDRILVVSYGSGAGADAFLLTMLRSGRPLPEETRKKTYLTYNEYMVRVPHP